MMIGKRFIFISFLLALIIFSAKLNLIENLKLPKEQQQTVTVNTSGPVDRSTAGSGTIAVLEKIAKPKEKLKIQTKVYEFSDNLKFYQVKDVKSVIDSDKLNLSFFLTKSTMTKGLREGRISAVLVDLTGGDLVKVQSEGFKFRKGRFTNFQLPVMNKLKEAHKVKITINDFQNIETLYIDLK